MHGNMPGVTVEPAEVHRVTVSAKMRESWGLMLGDAIGNLRQALDHIAWALAERTAHPGKLTESDARGIQFPIFDDRTAFERSGSLADRTKRFIDPVAWPTIVSHQPYPDNRRNKPELWMLSAVNELGNRDKHRVVTPTVNAASVRFPFDTDETTTVLYFDRETSLDLIVTPQVRVKVGGALEPEVTFDVVIRSRSAASGLLSVQQLPEIHRFIRDEVIPAFAGFFP
jgi:hypothetical protein